MVFLCRAMRVAGMEFSDGGTSVLLDYTDGGAVAEHARVAVATMISHGIMQGNDSNYLLPYRSLTRAQMAVMLHRALTM